AAVNAVTVQFLAEGRFVDPVRFTVDRVRDGRAFAARSIVACQASRVVAQVSVSYAVDDGGLEHQVPRRSTATPEHAPDRAAARPWIVGFETAFDTDSGPISGADSVVWVRANGQW